MTTAEDVERAKREAVRGDVVTVRWKCMRMFRDRWVFRECEGSIMTDVSRSDFDAREARARCPSCGGLLTQRADGFEVVSGVGAKREP